MIASKKQPDLTRRRLLEAAFAEIHRNGFRGASLDNILAETNVTKGALYHHFGNKAELGYAVVEEIIRPLMEDIWQPLLNSEDPLTTAIDMLVMRGAEMGEDAVRLGCPFNNLCQEMSALDPGFRERLQAILGDWREALTKALRQGQANGNVRSDINPDAAAAFIIASFEGCVGMAKTAQSPELLQQGMQGLIEYLDSLRRPAAA